MLEKSLQIAFLCFFLTSAFILNAFASNPADKLVLYMDFEETDGELVSDKSGSGNDGTILGNVEQVEGKVGQGMIFAGAATDYIKVEDSESLDISDVYSVMVWVNFSQIQGDRHQTFFDKGCQEATPGGWRLLKQMSGDIIWQTTKKGEWLAWVSFTPAPALVPEEWYHFAVTRDEDDTSTMYMNGEVRATSQSDNFSVAISEETMKIGGSTLWAESNMFIGMLDELAVYNERALTPDEIISAMEGINVSAVDSSGKLATAWGKIK